ncbi:MAG: hypothetical protein R3B46_14270 [Phycisphaerales bacterium]
MTFHCYDPSRNPEDHEELALSCPTTARIRYRARGGGGGGRTIPPQGAAPGVVFTEHAVAVNKDQARIRKEAACPQCGYSIVGLKSTKCPECGVELLPPSPPPHVKPRPARASSTNTSVAGVALGIAEPFAFRDGRAH